MVEVRIRRPVPADGPAIGAVHVRAWRRGYAGLVPPRFLASLDEADGGQAWTRRLVDHGRRGPELTEFLIAEAAGWPGAPSEVVGVATIGPERRGVRTGVGELWMINVAPATWRRGVGTRLLAAAERRLADRGFTTGVLWVLDGNRRARRFYESNGWERDGADKLDEFGGTVVREVRYARSLGGGERPADPEGQALAG